MAKITLQAKGRWKTMTRTELLEELQATRQAHEILIRGLIDDLHLLAGKYRDLQGENLELKGKLAILRESTLLSPLVLKKLFSDIPIM